MRRTSIIALGLLAAACAKPASDRSALDNLDDELTNGADPVAAAALNAPLMTDPTLSQTADADALRPPPRPETLGVPPGEPGAHPPVGGALTLGELARRQGDRRTADCAGKIAYSATWANRLPPELPLYPDAKVAEAAGNADCGLRVASFATRTAPGALLDWYRIRATKAGYSAERGTIDGQQVLGGTRNDDAYVIYAAPRSDGGADVDLIVNHGP